MSDTRTGASNRDGWHALPGSHLTSCVSYDSYRTIHLVTKSSTSLQTKLGHKLASTMYDNWLATLGAVVVARMLLLYRYPSMPNTVAWVVSALPVIAVSYAWLRVEHPDQAARVRRSIVTFVRFVVDIVKAIARFTTRLGDGGPIDDQRMATWREVRSERDAKHYERRTDPKPSATMRIEQDVWSTWGCPGVVIDYHRDDAEGIRKWVVALPEDLAVAQAARMLRDKISRGADVPSSL